ncbi:MAG TPA: tRNA lysidine(34) synthetase TilS [Dehalococcoidia bacterium]|nr:tRNA lysidine(34) synthetase TilS [Dehalococcoidia bacterium]
MQGSKIAKQLPRRVERFIAGHGLIDGPLVVGVSGGADSVCLLHVLCRLRDKLGLDLHVAHLNHQLRGAEADADAEHVSNLARQLGIAATIETRDVKAYQSATRSSLEEAAREVRYAFFADVAQATGAGAVAVGHTADDQAETLLMHLIRGTGLLGLRGMQPLSRWRLPLTSFRGWLDGTQLTVIRPLLEISREETEAYCAACELSPRLDSSNISSKYLRNRIRAELMSVLLEYNPGIRDSLRRAARTVAADIAHLDEEVARLWDSVAVERPDAVALDNQAFSVLSPALQRHLLRSVLGQLLGDLRDIELVQIEALLKVMERPAGKRLSLPGGLAFHGGYTESLITRAEHAPCPLPPLAGEHKLVIPGETMLSGWRVKTKVIEDKPWPVGDAGYNHASRIEDFWGDPVIGGKDFCRTSYKACLDFDLTGTQFVVRSRRDGDRFQPLGMGASKKLQDFMVDAKIPRAWRDRVPLVCAGEQIIWVVGWRIDHRVRVTDSTRRVLCLEFERGQVLQSNIVYPQFTVS